MGIEAKRYLEVASEHSHRDLVLDLKQRGFHDEIPDVESFEAFKHNGHLNMKYVGRVLRVIMITGLFSLLPIVAVAGYLSPVVPVLSPFSIHP